VKVLVLAWHGVDSNPKPTVWFTPVARNHLAAAMENSHEELETNYSEFNLHKFQCEISMGAVVSLPEQQEAQDKESDCLDVLPAARRLSTRGGSARARSLISTPK